MNREMVKEKVPKKNVHCHFCWKAFSHRTLLEAHLPKHNGCRQFRCKTCGKLFKYRENLSSHMQLVHSTERKFKCARCSKDFKSKSSLSVHEANVHPSHSPVHCGYCDKPFKTKNYLNDHVQLVHGEKKRKYDCSSCSLSFFSPKDLLRHAKIHSGVKEYQCNTCYKYYSRQSYLKSHMKTHGKFTEDDVVAYIEKIAKCCCYGLPYNVIHRVYDVIRY